MAGPDGLVADLGELLAVPDLSVRGPEGAIVLGDEWSVRQLFANLLGNSVKYVSPDRPLRVDVDLEVRGRRVLVGVTDNGRGIPEGEHESVFDRFSRADHAGSAVGTGIGLAICQPGGRAARRDHPQQHRRGRRRDDVHLRPAGTPA